MTILDPTKDLRTAGRDLDAWLETEWAGKKIRVVLNGVMVAECAKPLILHESGIGSRYYVPMSDVESDLLIPSERKTYNSYLGEAHHWSVRVGNVVAENAMWSYPDVYEDYCPEIAGWVTFDTLKVAQYVHGQPLFDNGAWRETRWIDPSSFVAAG
jgi:uncharacterized protein (DUF427 family)